jgi:hypothetical protein
MRHSNKNPAGVYRRDDLGRPLFAMRLHDVQVGAFAVIGKRHGNAALEVQCLQKAYEAHGQTLFPFFKEEVAV